MAIVKTELNIGDYFVYQDTDDYTFSADSVLLANTAKISSSDCVLDLGSGSGIIAALIAIKKHAKRVVGVEIKQSACTLATKTAVENGIDCKIEFICGDVKNITDFVKFEQFDKVVCNPPYFEKIEGARNYCVCENENGNESVSDNCGISNVSIGDTEKSTHTDELISSSLSPRASELVSSSLSPRASELISSSLSPRASEFISSSLSPRGSAKTESAATLADFISAAKKVLKFGGELTIIQKHNRLCDLMCLLRENNLEPKHIIYIRTVENHEPDTVIIRARKGAKCGLTSDTITLQHADGSYTEKFKELYS